MWSAYPKSSSLNGILRKCYLYLAVRNFWQTENVRLHIRVCSHVLVACFSLSTLSIVVVAPKDIFLVIFFLIILSLCGSSSPHICMLQIFAPLYLCRFFVFLNYMFLLFAVVSLIFNNVYDCVVCSTLILFVSRFGILFSPCIQFLNVTIYFCHGCMKRCLYAATNILLLATKTYLNKPI
jgi:hypothetical protein